ncbi:MAG: electron transfer flavoprotein subunit beta/FixA family protein [Candidatus Bathyarchaeia archaeon]
MPRMIVCLKYAVDVSQIKVDAATRKLLTADAPRKISDFDKNALEEAVKIREKHGGEVIALTATAENASTALREALAMGADKAYMVQASALQNADTMGTALILAEVIKKIGSFDLILCGEASIDSYSGQVGPRLGELLKVPVVTYVNKLELEGDVLKAERSLDECIEVVRVKMPALITVTKEINVPRVPTLMDVIKASRKELKTITPADLGISADLPTTIKVMDVSAPKVERKKVKISGENPKEIAENLIKTLIRDGVLGG